MMNTSDVEIYDWRGGKGFDKGSVCWSDPFPFKADEDVDLGRVFGAETSCFEEEEIVAGNMLGCIIAG